MNHQLIPLKKALELPCCNLFIADDVGLGKTIEAGLVMQELQLRQRVQFILIVCPASIRLQWQREMERRFGQRFEIYDREFVSRRRRERGFGVNPWVSHQRFIVSYHTLKRPEHIEPLLQHLGKRMKKSLLVLDEAHTAAPSAPGQYACDSNLTRLVRQLAPPFENRLFLSATPHNGHSNSFSTLLELLDPQRFTRGVPVEAGSKALERIGEVVEVVDEPELPIPVLLGARTQVLLPLSPRPGCPANNLAGRFIHVAVVVIQALRSAGEGSRIVRISIVGCVSSARTFRRSGPSMRTTSSTAFDCTNPQDGLDRMRASTIVATRSRTGPGTIARASALSSGHTCTK
jgi:hypothetical protein